MLYNSPISYNQPNVYYSGPVAILAPSLSSPIILNNLIHLNCSNTNIQELPLSLTNLIYLDISNTLIKQFSYRNCLNLEILISNNNLLEKYK